MAKRKRLNENQKSSDEDADWEVLFKNSNSTGLKDVTNKLNSAQTDNAESSRKQFGRHDSKAKEYIIFEIVE